MLWRLAIGKGEETWNDRDPGKSTRNCPITALVAAPAGGSPWLRQCGAELDPARRCASWTGHECPGLRPTLLLTSLELQNR